MENNIRNFIYLDTDRLNSLYSQTFEGVANTIVESYYGEMFRSDESKSAIKGKTFEEKVGEVSTKTENKILLDHMYNQLEDKLAKPIINANSIQEEEKLNEAFLVKIYGYVEIQDFIRMQNYFDKFNEIGEAIAYSSIPDGGNKSNNNIKELTKRMGLAQDSKMLNNLKLVYSFFNPDGYEIIITPIDNKIFTYRAIVDAKYLRISENKIRLLYSDKPVIPWTVMGQITYIPPKPAEDNEEKIDNEEDMGVSSINPSKNMFDSLSEVEKAFSEILRGKDEVRIAPIAIYIEK